MTEIVTRKGKKDPPQTIGEKISHEMKVKTEGIEIATGMIVDRINMGNETAFGIETTGKAEMKVVVITGKEIGKEKVTDTKVVGDMISFFYLNKFLLLNLIIFFSNF